MSDNPTLRWGKASGVVNFLRSVSSKRYDQQLWQDRDLLFDSPAKYLQIRTGEEIIQILEDVEDIKGKNGETGELMISNLRVIWISGVNNRTNISVGYNCVFSISIKNAKSRILGQTQSLFLLARFNNSQFEFVFSSNMGSEDCGQLFSIVQEVYRAYDNSKIYRDLKLRGNIIQDKQLKQLQCESVYNYVNGVWNLSSEQGNLGHFIVTNIRLVWYSEAQEGFNVSIPYLQIRKLKHKRSKFGEAIVVETVQRSGGYVLGFRIDPLEKLQQVLEELQAVWASCMVQPYLGIETIKFVHFNANGDKAAAIFNKMEEEVLDNNDDDRGDVLATYYVDAAKSKDGDPVYSQELGLAIESLGEGITLEQLWAVA